MNRRSSRICALRGSDLGQVQSCVALWQPMEYWLWNFICGFQTFPWNVQNPKIYDKQTYFHCDSSFPGRAREFPEVRSSTETLWFSPFSYFADLLTFFRSKDHLFSCLWPSDLSPLLSVSRVEFCGSTVEQTVMEVCSQFGLVFAQLCRFESVTWSSVLLPIEEE